MGFKWFRARMKIGKSVKQPLGVAGFYRTISQFDGDDTWPPAPKIIPKPYVIQAEQTQIPTLSISQNPIAILGQHETTERIITDKERSGNQEFEEDNEYDTPCINLPRESVELIRNGKLENNSPQQKVYKMKKSEMRKKGRAPLPRTTINSEEESVKLDNVTKSSEHEFEI